MKLPKLSFARGVIWSGLALCSLLASCKDDNPCDPGQIVRNSQCYPGPDAGGSSSDGDSGPDAGGATDAAAGAADTSHDTPFGTSCADTKASSDCGGLAPVCADLSPLGQGIICTQINCSAGEANAGICPSTFSCFAPSGYPSVCIKK